jgi:hypothetical protein
LVFGLRDPDRDAPDGYPLGAQLLVYFAVQSYTLRVSRFEVPLLQSDLPFIHCVGRGGDGVRRGLVCVRRATLKPAMLRAALPRRLILWLLPSVGMTVSAGLRGLNYKGIARWIMDNVPTNGIAAFHNVYGIARVPSVYPTPGRFVTCVAAWSNEEDYQRNQGPRRFEEMFTRFPLIRFMEVIPTDVLARNWSRNSSRAIGFSCASGWWTTLARPGRVAHLADRGSPMVFRGSMTRCCSPTTWPEDLPALAAKQWPLVLCLFWSGMGISQGSADERLDDDRTGGDGHYRQYQGQPGQGAPVVQLVAVAGRRELFVIGPTARGWVDNLKVPPEFRTVPVAGVDIGAGREHFPGAGAAAGRAARQVWVYAVTAEPDAD